MCKNIIKFNNVAFDRILNSGIMHLCTEFEIDLKSPEMDWDLVSRLHPTPAVCGIPLEASLELISKWENRDRSYYTGYLGPVNLDEGTSLFVNLRSAQFHKGEAAIFVGGGITADSDPESEWKETEVAWRRRRLEWLEQAARGQ